MVFCVKCGAQLGDDWRFCQKCGALVSADEPSTTSQVTKPPVEAGTQPVVQPFIPPLLTVLLVEVAAVGLMMGGFFMHWTGNISGLDYLTPEPLDKDTWQFAALSASSLAFASFCALVLIFEGSSAILGNLTRDILVSMRGLKTSFAFASLSTALGTHGYLIYRLCSDGDCDSELSLFREASATGLWVLVGAGGAMMLLSSFLEGSWERVTQAKARGS
jgi:hypothetical protein